MLFFAYGIFRFGLTAGLPDPVIEKGQAIGELYTRNDAYPEAYFYDSLTKEEREFIEDRPTIIGDVYELDAGGEEWIDICRTEFGAGYVPVVVEVIKKQTRLGNDGQLLGKLTTTVHAVAWHHPMAGVGTEIVGGDWKKYIERERKRAQSRNRR